MVVHIVGVDDFSRIRRTEAINLNPLCRLCHRRNPREGLTPDQIFILRDSLRFDDGWCAELSRHFLVVRARFCKTGNRPLLKNAANLLWSAGPSRSSCAFGVSHFFLVDSVHGAETVRAKGLEARLENIAIFRTLRSRIEAVTRGAQHSSHSVDEVTNG
jgi:hypothetical protein